MGIVKIFVAGLLALTLLGCGNGFADEDIRSCEEEIRREFGKREGVTVLDVTMMKESAKKLRGYAKLRMDLMGETMEVTKSCEANYMEGDQYIWECD